MARGTSCDVFVTETADAGFRVQFQCPLITITLAAANLRFVTTVLRFIETTRSDPKLRDASLGGGRFRRIPTTLVDVSSSFVESSVVCEKDGETDESFVVRVTQGQSTLMIFDIRDALLDAFVDSMKCVAEDYPEEVKAAEPGATDNPDDAQRN